MSSRMPHPYLRDESSPEPDPRYLRYTIRLRFGDEEYLLRYGDRKIGEPNFVVEPVGEKRNPFWQRQLQFTVERQYDELDDKGYDPDKLLSMAELLANRLDCEILGRNRPEHPPCPQVPSFDR